MLWRAAALIGGLSVAGCSWQGSLFQPSIVVPPGEKIVAGPSGAAIEEPDATPIETVITGLSQAQTTRMLVRQLSRP
jgi:hypothetical protein